MNVKSPKLAAAIALTLLSVQAWATESPTRKECSADAEAKNNAVARTVFEEVLSRGRIAENEHIYHAQFVAHGPNRDAGRDEDRAASIGWRNAAPDLRMDVLRVVTECDLVAVHWSGSGTNTGEGNGLPATGKAMANLWGMTIFRMQDGQIREEWTSFDQLPMMKQLGLLDPQPAAAAAK